MKKLLAFMVMYIMIASIFAGCHFDTNSLSEPEQQHVGNEEYTDVDVEANKNNAIDTKEKTVSSIFEINKNKPHYNENNKLVIPELSQYSGTSKYEEKEQLTRQYVDEHKSAAGEDINDKTFVYDEELLYPRMVPNCDYSRWFGNIVIKSMYGNLNAFPTEAIREDNGIICLIYDTDSGMRLFSWNRQFGGIYQQFGYVIYMAETLSYEDFANIKIGDYSDVVAEIDPKVTEINLRPVVKADTELKHTQARIENGVPPRSLHLLTDGLLIITYGRDETGFFVTDIEFNEDFMIDTKVGTQCCRIDPLDYVTQG